MDNENKTPKTRFYQSQLFRKSTEESPIVLVDVGARGGISRKWEPLEGMIKAIGFEPDENECRQLNEATGNNQVYFPVALFNKKGRIDLKLTRKLRCSSILEPNYTMINRFLASENYEVTDSIEVPCDTLDGLAKAGEIKDVDFIKLDTRGSELQILEGAENVLSEFCVFGIEIELEFSPLYRAQSLFAEVDGLLREKGFSLFDIGSLLGRKIRKTVQSESGDLKGQVLWAHAVYFRDFMSEKNRCLERLSLDKAVKTIAIAELHGFNDFALELSDFYLNKGIIGDSAYSDIRGMLTLKKKFRAELELYRNIRRSIGEFLAERFPFVLSYLVPGAKKSKRT